MVSIVGKRRKLLEGFAQRPNLFIQLPMDVLESGRSMALPKLGDLMWCGCGLNRGCISLSESVAELPFFEEVDRLGIP